MKPVRWFLVVALLGVTVTTWLAGSCAIDDDVAWAGGSQCTGTCTASPPSSFECDVDSRCTEAPGCEDWDCSESSPDDVDDSDVPSGDGDFDFGDAGEVREIGEGDCVPVGVGDTQDTAQPLTLGVEASGLSACLAVSGWLRFDARAGSRVEIALSGPDGAVLGFQIYAGVDSAVVNSVTIAGAGTFGLEATDGTTFFLRVRAMTYEPTPYSVAVRELSE